MSRKTWPFRLISVAPRPVSTTLDPSFLIGSLSRQQILRLNIAIAGFSGGLH
jgi:hypothetical protein